VYEIEGTPECVCTCARRTGYLLWPRVNVPENLIARSSVAWATVLIWCSATARRSLSSISVITLSLAVLNINSTVASYTASCNQNSQATLYYNMNIASQEYSIFLLIIIVWFMRAMVLQYSNDINVEMQVYAALNSVVIYIYRNLWTVACRQWWGLFPTDLGFVLFTS